MLSSTVLPQLKKSTIGTILGALALVMSGLLFVAPSESAAATYQYCNGCTINSGSYRASASSRYSDLSYVHRLSGPSGAVLIAAQAVSAINGIGICYNTSVTTQVTCNPLNYNVVGAAHNGGNGNYGFNAHLRY